MGLTEESFFYIFDIILKSCNYPLLINTSIENINTGQDKQTESHLTNKILN